MSNNALDLDVTGVSASNRIVGEPHSLSNRPTRSIAPNMGPFFSDSFSVMDGTRVLARGIDYQIVELHQEATLNYGKEIAAVALILDSTVSSTVTITYQALGGYYANSSTAIANMYQSVITDNRPVDWSNIFNRPTEYTPTIHRHLLEDVYGFEPVVDYLERIKRAITLGQTDVLLSAIRPLISKFDCRDLPKVRPSTKLVGYDAMLYFLSRRKILSNVWVDTVNCTWTKGDSVVFQVDTSGYPVGTTIYWEFYKPYGTVSLFTQKSGPIVTNGGIVDVSLYIQALNSVIDNPIYIGIKDSMADEEYKAVTYQLNIAEYVTTTESVGYLFGFNSQPNNLESTIAETASDDDLRLYYLLMYP